MPSVCSKLNIWPNTTPNAIVNEKNVFNGPRNEIVEISDMYIGAMLVDRPAPNPTKILAMHINSNDPTS